MEQIISIALEALFVLMILIHMHATNKSISRLEERLEELDTEVFKQIETPKPVTLTPRKKRTRKPKEIKDIS